MDFEDNENTAEDEAPAPGQGSAPEPVAEPTPAPVPEPVPVPEPEPEPAPAPEPEPMPTYTYEPAPTYTPGPSYEPVGEPAGRKAADKVRDGLHDAAQKAADWLNDIVPGHGNTILFGIVGLILALLVFEIGVWRSFVVLVLVVGGMTFGQYLDGDPKILRFIRDLLKKDE